MSIQVLCPSCTRVTELYRPPVTACPVCHQEYPEELKVATDRALRTASAPKPALLVLGQAFSLIGGLVFLVVLVSAPFDAGTYHIGDEPVSGPEFMKRAGWIFGVVGALWIAIGLLLIRDVPAARPLMLSYWLLSPLVLVATAESGGSEEVLSLLLVSAVAAGISWWYLYRKPNVAAYFESRREGTAPDGA